MSQRPDDGEDPRFDRTPPAASGEMTRLSPLIRRIVAPNPGPFTFTGTCAYVVGNGEVAVIDPGPADEAHIDSLLRSLKGEKILFVLATHTHRDHSPGCSALREAVGASVVGCAPFQSGAETPAPRSQDLDYAPDLILQDGEALAGPGFALAAVATPGHASNHLSFALGEENALFSGDCVMAWSTTVVSPPDGDMSDYMRSLDRLKMRGDSIYWPGHGGPVRDPQRFVRALANHRRRREKLILAELRAGDRSIDEIVSRLYLGLDPRLKGGAARSVLAHLIDLSRQGKVIADGPLAQEARYRIADVAP